MSMRIGKLDNNEKGRKSFLKIQKREGERK